MLNISSIFNQVLISFVNPTLFLKDILMYKMLYYSSLQALFSLFTDLVYYQNYQINIVLTMMRFFLLNTIEVLPKWHHVGTLSSNPHCKLNFLLKIQHNKRTCMNRSTITLQNKLVVCMTFQTIAVFIMYCSQINVGFFFILLLTLIFIINSAV